MLLNKMKSGLALLITCAGMLVITVQAQSLRDPTQPGVGAVSHSVSQQQGTDTLKLNSVLISDNSATAIFNNKMFTLGDRVQGVKIVRINASGVWLADGRHFTLYQAVTETKGQ